MLNQYLTYGLEIINLISILKFLLDELKNYLKIKNFLKFKQIRKIIFANNHLIFLSFHH